MNEVELERYIKKVQEKQHLARLSAAVDQAVGYAPDLDYLVFAVGGEEFAVKLQMVKSVLALPRATAVPYVPNHYLGVFNLHGRIVSLIDLRIKQQLAFENTPETSAVVLEWGKNCIGVVVDSVNRVLSVQTEKEVEPVTIFDFEKILDGGTK